MTVTERQKELLEEFADLDSWQERYHLIIDLGMELSPYPEEFRLDELKISGCTSQVWLHARMEGEKLFFDADSDSIFVKGEIALLTQVYSDAKPQEILSAGKEWLSELGISENLSPNRANGLGQMLKAIYAYAEKFNSTK